MTVHIIAFAYDQATGGGSATFSDGDYIEFAGILPGTAFIALEDGINHHREQLILRKIAEVTAT